MSFKWLYKSSRNPSGKFTDKYKYDEKDFLGEGQYGKVYKCYLKSDPSQEFAAKMIHTKKMSKVDQEALQTEIRVMEDCKDGEHCVRMYDSFVEKTKVVLVLELVKGGELFDRIVSKQNYTERDAAATVKTIALALKYIHDKNIVHRDLKPENLLLISPTDDSTVKLADFGFADYCEIPLQEGCGTLTYVAPEVLRNKPYKTEPDMWSLGVITYILLCGYPPYFHTDQYEMSKMITSGKYRFRNEDWGDISKEAKLFVRKLLKRDTEKRLTADQVLQDPWIVNMDKVPAVKLNKAKDAIRVFVAQQKMRKAITTMHTIIHIKNMMNFN